MKVRDLRERLSRLDQDLPVFVRGYEGGVDDIDAIRGVLVALDVNDEWYYGQHEVISGVPMSDWETKKYAAKYAANNKTLGYLLEVGDE